MDLLVPELLARRRTYQTSIWQSLGHRCDRSIIPATSIVLLDRNASPLRAWSHSRSQLLEVGLWPTRGGLQCSLSIGGMFVSLHCWISCCIPCTAAMACHTVIFCTLYVALLHTSCCLCGHHDSIHPGRPNTLTVFRIEMADRVSIEKVDCKTEIFSDLTVWYLTVFVVRVVLSRGKSANKTLTLIRKWLAKIQCYTSRDWCELWSTHLWDLSNLRAKHK